MVDVVLTATVSLSGFACLPVSLCPLSSCLPVFLSSLCSVCKCIDHCHLGLRASASSLVPFHLCQMSNVLTVLLSFVCVCVLLKFNVNFLRLS